MKSLFLFEWCEFCLFLPSRCSFIPKIFQFFVSVWLLGSRSLRPDLPEIQIKDGLLTVLDNN